MAALCNISLLLCVTLCVCANDVRDRAASPFIIEKLCSDKSLLENKKLLCIICRGWDLTCWSTTATPTSTTNHIETKPSSSTTKTEPTMTEAPSEGKI